MSSEESDSQMSAMFDDELPQAQCELLLRRLVRDDSLRIRWGRYATIGAAMRAEPLALRAADHLDLATRVRTALRAESLLDAQPVPRASRMTSWYKGALGTVLAAGVAAMSIMILRVGAPPQAPVAAVSAPDLSAASEVSSAASQPPQLAAADSAPSYVVPPTGDQLGVRTSAQLANYVVAHSEYAAPVVRLNRLSSFMTSDIDAQVDIGDIGDIDSRDLPADAQPAR